MDSKFENNDSSCKKVLGAFIRNARSRISPQSVGLTSVGRRRTPGLRREEVAMLCDISVTWYTWIEQGRKVAVSSSVWDRLARVLNLSRAERSYLFELAEINDIAAEVTNQELSGDVLQTVQAINGPAYMLNRSWDILSFNNHMDELLQGWLSQKSKIDAHGTIGTPNLLHFIFLSDLAPAMLPDWEHRAARAVAEFRAGIGIHIDQPATQNLITNLQVQSAKFAYWWDRQSVEGREGGQRVFQHPQWGEKVYMQVNYHLAIAQEIKLVVLLPLNGK